MPSSHALRRLRNVLSAWFGRLDARSAPRAVALFFGALLASGVSGPWGLAKPG